MSTMIYSKFVDSSRRWLALVFLSCPLWLGNAVMAEQMEYGTPEIAANTLVIAAAQRDQARLEELLGEDYRELLPLDDVDAGDTQRFLDSWIDFHAVIPVAVDEYKLAVGSNGWQLPIPIVRGEKGWRFDTLKGAAIMRIRRIGRNELSAMQAALAYHDAQMDYAMVDWDGDGLLEFAQRFASSPGKKDGLYWDASQGGEISPLGPLFHGDVPDDDYFGYKFRILTAQGAQAPGGAYDYLVDGNMRRGFGLVAWPAEYGESGVMSFMLNRDGVLYEADLGPESRAEAESMTGFNPNADWKPVSREFTAL